MDLRLLIVVASLLLAGCVQPAGRIVEDVDLADFGADGDPFLGNPDAAIQVVAYEAPACGSCRFYHANNFPTIEEEFIDTGLIGYHLLQWTVGDSYDRSGGVALECVHRDGGSEAYMAMFERVFENQFKTELIPDMLTETATEFGLDDGVLQICYENEETLAELNQDLDKGRESGAGNNPGFAVIKGDQVRILRGSAGPYAAIEAML